jgi:hypothetical protein
MAESHKRVEARTSVIGTGMATEPDRIERLAKDAERRQRSVPPQQAFADVLESAPAQGELADNQEDAAPPPKAVRSPASPRQDPRARALHASFDRGSRSS